MSFDPQLSLSWSASFGGSLFLHYWQRGFPWYLSNEYLLLRLLVTCLLLLLLLLNRLLISLLNLATGATLRLVIITTDLALILVLWMLAECLFTKSNRRSVGYNFEIPKGTSQKYHKIKHVACHRDFFLHVITPIKHTQNASFPDIKHLKASHWLKIGWVI